MSTSSTERGAAEKLALPLMVLSFLALGGFLYWLNITAEPTEVTIVEEEAEGGSGSAISVDEFLASPEAQTGQSIEVAGARVSSRLGTQAFWIGPDDRPYLVKMSPDLVAAGGTVLVEQIVSLRGTVHTMSDSVLNAWQELGAFSNDGDRIVAEFATSFFEVDEIVGQAEGGGDAGG
jgi:hypothetical protein